MSRPRTRAAIVATSPVTRLIRARVSSETWCSGRSLSYNSPAIPPPNVSNAAVKAMVAAVTCVAPSANYRSVIPEGKPAGPRHRGRRPRRGSGREFTKGEIVATAMGGMGRDFDDGYAEYTCVPASQVQVIKTNLPGRPWVPLLD